MNMIHKIIFEVQLQLVKPHTHTQWLAFIWFLALLFQTGKQTAYISTASFSLFISSDDGTEVSTGFSL